MVVIPGHEFGHNSTVDSRQSITLPPRHSINKHNPVLNLMVFFARVVCTMVRRTSGIVCFISGISDMMNCVGTDDVHVQVGSGEFSELS